MIATKTHLHNFECSFTWSHSAWLCCSTLYSTQTTIYLALLPIAFCLSNSSVYQCQSGYSLIFHYLFNFIQRWLIFFRLCFEFVSFNAFSQIKHFLLFYVMIKMIMVAFLKGDLKVKVCCWLKYLMHDQHSVSWSSLYHALFPSFSWALFLCPKWATHNN